MSPTTIRARAGILVAILSCLAFTPLGASANHGADDVYLQQVGNGGGDSVPVIRNFGLVSSLFNNSRFPSCLSGTCVQRTFPKHLAFGVINADVNGTPILRVAMVRGSDDGLRWGTPEPATIQKPSGDTPFALGSTATHFDVMYNGTNTTTGNAPNYPFSIYYKLAPVSTGSTIAGIHVADSEDGINWVNDRPLTQDAANPLVGSPTGTAFTYGPMDVIFQPSVAPSASCAAAVTNPWNCRVVMLYNAFDSGSETVRIAGSNNGTNFTAYPTVILAGTASSWDQSFAGWAGVRVRTVSGVKQYAMIYSGSNASGTCAGGQLACMKLGSATSADGLIWVKSAGNPMTPNTLPGALDTPSNSDTLLNAEPIDDASGSGHSKVFFSAYANQVFPRRMDTYLASTASAPAAGPSITISSPASGFRTVKPTPIEVYATDTDGTSIGLNLGTLSLKIDGIPVDGATFTNTTVTSYRYVGKKIQVAPMIQLADGAHTFEVSLADLDGNVTVRSTSFTVDTTAPSTLVTAAPAGPSVGFPNSIGTFFGTTTDNAGGTGIARVRASVRNPLGTVKTYESSAPSGFNVTATTTHSWTWNWVAPALDPHFALPGEYTVTLGGVDVGGAVEKAAAANTVTLLVV